MVVIGIGGSYLGAKCALEALSHQFAKQLKNKGEAPEIVFAGQNLSEEYMCELMDLVQERNAACVVISKSGTTTEPAVAFRLVKKIMPRTMLQIIKYVIISDNENPFISALPLLL